MPVDNLGYRPWKGDRMSQLMRPLVVAYGGITLVWRRKWLRFMILFSWLPILIFGVGVFVYEYSSSEPSMRPGIARMLAVQLDRPDLAMSMLQDHTTARHDVWSLMILTFFRTPQLFAMVLLVGLIAPMLISYDLRSKAYLMYFSRPLSPFQYIVGKSAVIWFFLSMITAVPAFALYVVAIMMSPDLSVVGDTWDIPIRIAGATAVLVVPTSALALCYSSFTSESRYASFSWFATWVMGGVAYSVLTFAGTRMRPRRPPRGERFGDVTPEAINETVPGQIAIEGQEFLAQRDFGAGGRDFGPPQGGFGPPRGRRGFDVDDLDRIQMDQQSMLEAVDLDKWRLVSPYHTLGKVQEWVFGLETTDGSVIPAIVMLVVITLACWWIIRRRIVARLSV